MKVPEKSRKMPSIAHSLGQAGYQNTFYYGGDINFTNMRSYVLGTGYDRLVWKADYTSDEQSTCQWGVRDDIMFDTLLADIQKEQNNKPWMKTLLTLSSHEPWDVPTKVLDDEVYNAFNYLDQCIGRFIDDLRKTPTWKNTLVVILPDHGYRYKGIDESTRLYNHIPMLWVGGAVRQPVVIDCLCNQSDLAATLLGQLGIRHDDFRFSRDIASNSYRQPMAYHNSTSCVSVYDTTGWMAYDIDANSMIANESNDSERLLRLSKAILQLTSHDLKNK
jgi:phosphoglycerol transferase MdoB-like AlkP superfamily enzyme